MFCPRCGNQVDEQLNFCSSCGARLREDNFENTQKNVHIPKDVRSVRPKKKSKLPVIIAVIIVLGVCLVGGTILMTSFGGSGKKGGSNSLVWLSDETFRGIDNPNTKDTSQYQYDIDTIRENYSGENTFNGILSPDGKYFYYFSRIAEGNVGTLYRAELAKMHNEKDKDKYRIRIDNNVDIFSSSVNVFEDGTAVYIIREGNITNISYFDGEKSISVAKNVTDYSFSLEKSVIYSKEDGNGKQALYYQILEEGSEAKKFVEGVSAYSSLSDTLVLCMVYNEEEEWDGDLYIAGVDKKPELISSGVTDWDYEKDSDIIYYKTEQSNMITLADAVTYESYQEDKKIKEPDTDNPLYYDKSAGWWGSYTDAYYEAMDKYREAQSRLEIIESLKESEYNLKTKSLYCYHIESGESEKLCGNITRNCIAHDDGKMAVGYFKGVSQLQPVDITNILSEGYESTVLYVENAIEQACIDKGALYFRLGDGEEIKVDFKEELAYSNLDELTVKLFDKGSHIAYAAFGNNTGDDISYTDLYVAEIKEDKIGDFTSVNHSVSSIGKYGERLVAFDDIDAYIYMEDDMRILGDNTISFLKCYEDGTVYYVDDNDKTLYTFDKHGEKTVVLYDVETFSVLNNGDILYISQGTLYRYDGKEKFVIDYDTYRYWTLNEKNIID